jgi:hypothetical protein
MRPLGVGVVVLILVIAALVATQFSDIQRYLKMRSM